MNQPKVNGMNLDSESRCEHYHSEVDVVAIKFYCCHKYYACYYCHQELTDHSPAKWPKDQQDEYGIMCGHCKNELPISQYMNTSECPHCSHRFNERCSNHFPLYFEM
ncbi:CHY zinc finger protein [Halobacillus sp. Marseille-P3879]|uniref:CHY zinc finger protein n=1 Tax=Halobacillus sp. Marseille-P3879 TaxID=2045014 RepID=UPI000C7AB70C|nr:CHY zinc finger protein [Halobacillus sp. Marseille-P3879]